MYMCIYIYYDAPHNSLDGGVLSIFIYITVCRVFRLSSGIAILEKITENIIFPDMP